MLKANETYTGVVIKIEKTYALIKVQSITGIVHISEISDYHVKDIGNIISVGSTYNFKFLQQKGDKYVFSYKQLYPKLLKVRDKIIATPGGFKNVYDKMMKELK
ncbi:MAG: S1 RNA-binding domain-containing protein [Mycoplasmataceae bacterium]|jgi:general stress protein 13|nr:S1 RNA-binding domain-containing protein [Mycoplasmataceae bacterium]